MSFDASRQSPDQSVGAKLRAARQARKLTQSELAQPDFSVSYVSAIERGQIQPSLRALEILARRLGLHSSDLLPPNGQIILSGQATQNDDAPGEQERALLVIEAQIALYQGESETAILLLHGLLEQKKKPDDFVLVAALLGQAYLESGQLQESEQILSEAARMAGESRDPLYSRVLILQSAVYAAVHKNERAIQLLQQSLSILTQNQPEEVFLLARVYASLGQHYLTLGNYVQAHEMFRQALERVEKRTTSEQLQPIYEDLVQFYFKKQDHSLQSELAAQKWFQADWQARLTMFTCQLQHELGRAWLKHDVQAASDYLQALLQQAINQKNPLLQASASVHLASWYGEQQTWDQAETLARSAVTLAEPFGETQIAAEACMLLGELLYRRASYQEGDDWFKKGLAILEHLDARDGFVESATCYARHLEERNLLAESLVFWKKAFAARQKHHDGLS
jgi:tetratricopeptide (TPR) repeat protein